MNKTCNVTRMLIFNPIKTGFGNPILPMGLSVQWLPWFISHSSHNTTHETFNTQLTAQYTQHSQHMQHTTEITTATHLWHMISVSQTCKEYYGPAQKSFCLSICLSACLSIFLTSCWHSEQLLLAALQPYKSSCPWTRKKECNFFQLFSLVIKTRVVQNVNRMSER